MRITIPLFVIALFSANFISYAEPIVPPVTKQQAHDNALQQFPGKVIKVSEAEGFFKVRILQGNGIMIDVTVNKQTGEITKDK